MEIIGKAKYEGYLWYSDRKEPEVYTGSEETEIRLDDNANPFAIEGNLWNAKRRESIAIKYVDGRHLVRRCKVEENELKGCETNAKATTLKTYIPHRIKGVKNLKFLQYWKANEDEQCEGMKVLEPEKLVFVGFEK